MTAHYPNHLQVHRKRFYISQTDIAVLMDINDHTILSHFENGRRTPSIEMLLIYHLLFDTSIESFLPGHKEALRNKLLERISILINKLKSKDKIPKVQVKVKFLESTLNRLNNANQL